jgi:hypothetical protein
MFRRFGAQGEHRICFNLEMIAGQFDNVALISSRPM